ncbi:hypothetical protein Bbelb_394190 [Branchiostoma belcheri]|nr:hypothetical protein Bbelb_394190 [Branchiostoma belcheri]
MGSADVFSDKASSEMLRKDDVSLATPRRLFPACWGRVPVSLFPETTTGLRQFRHQAGINNRQPAWLHPITANKRSWTGKTEIVVRPAFGADLGHEGRVSSVSEFLTVTEWMNE